MNREWSMSTAKLPIIFLQLNHHYFRTNTIPQLTIICPMVQNVIDLNSKKANYSLLTIHYSPL